MSNETPSNDALNARLQMLEQQVASLTNMVKILNSEVEYLKSSHTFQHQGFNP